MRSDGELSPKVRSILSSARARTPPDGGASVDARDLPGALESARDRGRRPVIAEVKPTSPTTQGHRDDDPVALAERMVAGGAAALSVLTEPEHFGGSPETLERVRAAVDVPVLRKDFVLDERELDRVEADSVLLIARFLDDLEAMVEAARDRGFRPLVEVHTRGELDRALAAGATLVGVNNRDLAQLEVDRSTFERVVSSAPAGALDGVTLVAESGIRGSADAERMLEAGADGLLVGTAIMAGDVRENTEGLTGAGGQREL